MSILKIINLSKTYTNGIKALDKVSLEIQQGLFGLLGPNGAGKSSLLRTIATLQEADSGSITYGDIDFIQQPSEVRKILGYLPQEFGLYPSFTAISLLDHFAILKGVANKKERKEIVEYLLHKTNLYSQRKQKLKTYSGGMKQRFGIAQALLADPKIIIVDEPTAGLDPSERNRFHRLLCALGEHSTIILSTHIVDDVAELCTDMAIVDKGKVLLHSSPENALSEIAGKVYEKIIEKKSLDDYKIKYTVIGEKLRQGKTLINVLSNSHPGAEFRPIQEELDHVYFSQMERNSMA